MDFHGSVFGWKSLRTFSVALSIYLLTVTVGQNIELLPVYDLCNPKTAHNYPPTVFLRDGASTEVFFTMTCCEPQVCLMMFKTEDKSQIQVEPADLNFQYHGCLKASSALEYEQVDYCDSGCVYMKLVDTDYKRETLRILTDVRDLRRMNEPYTSQSSKLHLVACGNGMNMTGGTVRMKVRLRAVAKHRVIEGYVGTATQSAQMFTSPFFPKPYVKNSEVYTYTFRGISGSDATTVAITFDDWSIAPHSSVKFSDESGRHRIYTSTTPRPYIIAGSQDTTLTFDTGANVYTGSHVPYFGFKAVARFYRYYDDVPQFYTDCDETISKNTGGVIGPGRTPDGRIRDCIWVIKPFSGRQVYLKVIQYKHGWKSWSNKLRYNSLEIRSGLTSESPLVLHETATSGPVSGFKEHTSVEGFYVRLKGNYADDDPLVIAYSQFRTGGAAGLRDMYKCDNGRYISDSLICDGYDHCGDASDEEYCDPRGSSVTNNESRYNYNLSIGIIIPMVVAVFLIIVICLLVVFFRRCRRMRRDANGNSGCVLIGGRSQSRDGGRRRSRDRRRRHHSSRSGRRESYNYGDFPPSYDEALHSTPTARMNSAFQWSDYSLGQPPSYEDAMIEAAPPYSDSMNNNNGSSSMATNTTETTSVTGGASRNGSVPSVATTVTSGAYPLQLHGTAPTSSASGLMLAQHMPPTLNHNLDPGAYVSSSESSGASETETRMDVSSESESSTDNDGGFVLGENTSRSARSMENLESSISRGTAGVLGNKPPGRGSDHDMPVIVKDPKKQQKGKDSGTVVCGEGRKKSSGRIGENDSMMIHNEGDVCRRESVGSLTASAPRNDGSPSTTTAASRVKAKTRERSKNGRQRGRHRNRLKKNSHHASASSRGRNSSGEMDASSELSDSFTNSLVGNRGLSGGEVCASLPYRLSPEGEAQGRSLGVGGNSRENVSSILAELYHNELVRDGEGDAQIKLHQARPHNKTVSASDRSQSCFNLHAGASLVSSPTEERLAAQPDKRFSYAGAGDRAVGGWNPLHSQGFRDEGNKEHKTYGSDSTAKHYQGIMDTATSGDIGVTSSETQMKTYQGSSAEPPNKSRKMRCKRTHETEPRNDFVRSNDSSENNQEIIFDLSSLNTQTRYVPHGKDLDGEARIFSGTSMHGENRQKPRHVTQKSLPDYDAPTVNNNRDNNKRTHHLHSNPDLCMSNDSRDSDVTGSNRTRPKSMSYYPESRDLTQTQNAKLPVCSEPPITRPVDTSSAFSMRPVDASQPTRPVLLREPNSARPADKLKIGGASVSRGAHYNNGKYNTATPLGIPGEHRKMSAAVPSSGQTGRLSAMEALFPATCVTSTSMSDTAITADGGMRRPNSKNHRRKDSRSNASSERRNSASVSQHTGAEPILNNNISVAPSSRDVLYEQGQRPRPEGSQVERLPTGNHGVEERHAREVNDQGNLQRAGDPPLRYILLHNNEADVYV